ncbi:MAG: hypothetical protein MR874_09935 [Coriobacteriaceae bacterium]|uniref:hypothetical protein n=1 Tax=Tractidigestivibacter sp. TaxID=2847320 RepID=UPI002A8328CA|nr:hypothetical protein [Tractidigestivibacter sp.]MCI6548769.1 hypothetical protein [Coriobacteriaceae bacterium]MCI6845056.1 hypothetical protein [Coriobacteriaceae bacterium]MCI7438219.1 hypothetical protein [Coriobacteriaceae bacterium]MDD7583693.1 hypothetical protein [Coriobacteriaceae bacterium]MDY4534813.1 hypothetical protein [Tractidigestivibacter sp.]
MTDQERFDGLLSECDSCLRRIGLSPRAYLPSVRLTHNRSRIGSCKKLRGGRRPLFQISCSVDACATDAQVRDVLFHELIHTLPGCFDHGNRFREAAAKANAAYGTEVRATRREPARRVPEVPRWRVAPLVGTELLVRGRRYRFVGMNDRPKRCCNLTDERGRSYVCAPAYVLAHLERRGMG